MISLADLAIVLPSFRESVLPFSITEEEEEDFDKILVDLVKEAFRDRHISRVDQKEEVADSVSILVIEPIRYHKSFAGMSMSTRMYRGDLTYGLSFFEDTHSEEPLWHSEVNGEGLRWWGDNGPYEKALEDLFENAKKEYRHYRHSQ